MAEARAELFEDLGGQRRGAGDEEAHGGADLARGFGGHIEQAHVDGGDAEEERRAEIEELGGGLLMLEALQQAHAAAAGEPAVQAVAEGVDVEERQREQEAVGGGDLPAGEQVDGVGGEIVVGEDGAFGRAGGAGGVDDAGGRVAIERRSRGGRGHGGGFGGEFGGVQSGRRSKARRRSTAAGSASLQDVRDLAVAIEDVDGDEDDAELDAGEIEVDHLDAVGEVDAEAVAGL